MRAVRIGAALLLAGCSSVIQASDDIAMPQPFDATVSEASFPDVSAPDASSGTPFNGGGPLACAQGCVCDGTLYACSHDTLVDGGCPGGGGPGAPILDAGVDAAAADAAADADAADASACELAGNPCLQIPVVCLPKPTCACITQATGMTCDVDPSGNGFVLMCPPPPP
jgi:hypothetical protein